ncbi:MAG: RES family NAD+ phosphorylase [Verrucomicrobiales bacterium]|nr:RES family NAD+ phosphorylase [Verrucomicrobiales bacterium]
MPAAWRILKAKHGATAFSGEGAAKTGGRWNSRGVPVVYSSSTKALAALESLVHLNPPVIFKYVAIRLEFDDAFIEKVALDALPLDWRTEPPPPSTKQLGDAWTRSGRSAILAVPSALIPDELNYILNPAHPDCKRITIGKPEEFTFDPRLLT